MPFFSWDTAPEPVRAQIKRFVRDTRAILGENLAGIYLHGSLALGCFNPDRSDIDLLVVIRQPMAPETKRLMAGLMLAQSGAPRPLEVSWVLEMELKRWRHPFPYDLHFSESWRERFEANLTRLDWEVWLSREKLDRDLAAHFTILLRRGGVVLYGPPVQQIFPVVPVADYIDALFCDFEPCRDRIGDDPVYSVLNLLRVCLFLLEGEISSKEEAGRWGMRNLPDAELRAIAATALGIYAGNEPAGEFTPEGLARFARYIDTEVERLLMDRATDPTRDRAVECLRCRVPMRFVGVSKSMLEDQPLRIFCCPSCGKAEFFLQPVPAETK